MTEGIEMISGNSRAERLGMWVMSTIGRLTRDATLCGSPSLAMIGLRPSLRWAWSGNSAHARKVHESPAEAFSRGVDEDQ